MVWKVWTLISLSLILRFHYIHSECVKQDLSLMDEKLMNGHIFEMKEFFPKSPGNELLSVLNTLCSLWTRNMNRTKFSGITGIFRTIISSLAVTENKDKAVLSYCASHNCTYASSLSYINQTEFVRRYKSCCNESLSGLRCPTKSQTIPVTVIPSITGSESQTITATVIPSITGSESQTYPVTIIPSITGPESLRLPADHRLQTILAACSILLLVSLLLNVFLCLKVMKKVPQSQTEQPNSLPVENSGIEILTEHD